MHNSDMSCRVVSCRGVACRVNGVLSCRCVRSAVCTARAIETSAKQDQAMPWWGGSKCSCLDSNCHRCKREAHGDTCLICRNSMYLHEGKCVATCPSHLTSSGLGQWKRRCLEPFQCKMHTKPSNVGKILSFEVVRRLTMTHTDL